MWEKKKKKIVACNNLNTILLYVPRCGLIKIEWSFQWVVDVFVWTKIDGKNPIVGGQNDMDTTQNTTIDVSYVGKIKRLLLD